MNASPNIADSSGNRKRKRENVLVFPSNDTNTGEDFSIHENDYHSMIELLSTSDDFPADDEGEKAKLQWMKDNAKIAEGDEERRVRQLKITTGHDCPSLISSITSLSPSIGKLQHLELLDLEGSNKLIELPNEIGDLAMLKTLNLSTSRIRSIPPSIRNLRNLKELDLACTNYLFELPEELGELASLETLDLLQSSVSVLPPSIGNLRKLKNLDVSSSSLLELPDQIGELASLETLKLGYSKFNVLPNSIGNLRQLKMLSLTSAEHLSELPEEFGNLSSILELDFSYSAIRSLPSSFTQLKNLERLNLSGASDLRDLPAGFWNLKKLKELHLGGTDLTVSSDCLKNLTDLMILGIRATSIPQDDLLELATHCPMLGEIYGYYDLKKSTKLEIAVACNKARFRNGFVELTPKLWPHVLENAPRAFDAYRSEFREGPHRNRILQPDAIYQLLSGSSGSFVEILTNRDIMDVPKEPRAT